MLYLIGIGLDKDDVSVKGLKLIKQCKKVYWENYTNVYPYSQSELEKVLGIKVIPAGREFVESGEQLLKEAKSKKIALLISGDPLSATTHVDLMLRAKEKKIKTKIIHSSSVFTAVAETGLQLYKFGKTGSIAKWQKSFRPDSFYDIIKGNLIYEAHTLLLIDIGLSVQEALGYLETIAKARDPQMLDRTIIICEKLGTDKRKFVKGKISSLMNKKFKLPACIVIPGKLHFMEEEALNKL